MASHNPMWAWSSRFGYFWWLLYWSMAYAQRLTHNLLRQPLLLCLWDHTSLRLKASKGTLFFPMINERYSRIFSLASCSTLLLIQIKILTNRRFTLYTHILEFHRTTRFYKMACIKKRYSFCCYHFVFRCIRLIHSILFLYMLWATNRHKQVELSWRWPW